LAKSVVVENEMMGMPCLHSKITAATTTVFFLAFFQLAEFFFWRLFGKYWKYSAWWL